LSAPVLNISSADNYTLLVAAAFAAVVAAQLRSLAVGVIAGLGTQGYLLALQALARLLKP